MIHLYAAPTTNGLRAKIMLDECGLDYRLHVIDIAAGEQKQPPMLARNPDGLVPVMVDEDGPGGDPLTLAQSMAILIYLAEKTGKFLPRDPMKRALCWQAAMNAATDVAPAVVSIFLIQRRSGEPGSASQKVFENRFRDFMIVWDDRLSNDEFCAGGEVSIADFALYPVFARCRDVIPDITGGFANVDRWCARMAARDGVAKGMTFQLR